jgi:predicted Rossmann-fold nucleotide-binding protein
VETIEMTRSSAHKIKNICVFGGFNPMKENEFLESTNHLSRVLPKRKIHLMYGGGSLGLIESVGITSFLRDSQIFGIIQKPIGLLNVNDFYNNLLSFLDYTIEQKLITSSTQRIIISALLNNRLINYKL